MNNINTRIQELEKELKTLKDLVESPPFLVGKIYKRRSTNNIYSFIDWNGEIRLFNITLSHCWKSKKPLKSRIFREPHKQKAETLPRWAAIEAFSNVIGDFYLAENL